MPENVRDIRTHVFGREDKLFVDANVWLYVYGPASTDERLSKVYSAALSKIRTFRSQLFTHILVISEFVNTFARSEWRRIPEATRPRFKDYRSTPDFREVAEEISINGKRILKSSFLCNARVDSPRLLALLDEYAHGRSDFNDLMIIELCKSEGFTLITHDRDFSNNAEMEILTANEAMLADSW